MLHVLGCITQQHDLRLVALAGVLCLLACFTAASMVIRGRAAAGRLRWLWLAAAGVVFGSGIWATHFVAMLAFRAGFPAGYDATLTIVSIAVAITASATGFAIALHNRPLVGGAVAGTAISAMHYVGMMAVRIPATEQWNDSYVIASVAVGVGLCALGLNAALRGAGIRSLSAGALLLTVAIIAMHFTGMSAVTYRPDSGVTVPNALVDPMSLAIAVGAVGALIVALGMVGAIVDYYLARREVGEAERLRRYIAELEETKRSLEATSQTLSHALVAAEAASETKAQFLASMSHELRTPLNAIIGFSDFLIMEAFGPIGNQRYRDYVKDIRESGTLLLSLINDILDLSRLDAGQATLRDEILDLGDVIAEAVRMVRVQANDAGVDLSEHVEAHLPHVRGDRRRVLQVMLNLASNAIKFTPAGGAVRITAFLRGDEVTASVSDTGIGIAEADIPKALERFGQVDSRLARKYQGAGLGLPLARQLMALHGGKLTLESKLNRGTTVTISFPVDRVVLQTREVA
jgi:signal transduction histidine kinase